MKWTGFGRRALLPRRVRRYASAALAVACLLTLLPYNAQATTIYYTLKLDPAFGAGGLQSIDFGSRYEGVSAAVTQPDGKVVLVGKTQSIDGNLTRAAGGGRLSTTCVESIVTGVNRIDFALTRLNGDGSLDASFGVGGKVTTDIGAEDEAKAVTLQPDGKIVVVGLTYSSFSFPPPDGPFNKIAVARYNTNGTLDQSFDGDGKVITEYRPENFDTLSVAISGSKIMGIIYLTHIVHWRYI